MTECMIDGCGKGQKSRGLCPMHLNRFYRHGDPTAVVKPQGPRGRTCDVDGCGRKHAGRGLCGSHLGRWKAHGDVFADIPIGDHAAMLAATRPPPPPDPETCVDCDDEAFAGTIRCQRHLFADLRRRSARKPWPGNGNRRGDDPSRVGVRQVRSFGYAGRQGAA